LKVDLGAESANQANLKVRIREYEPNDDWGIAVDDLKIDDVPQLTSGSIPMFSENFDTKTPRQHAGAKGSGKRGWIWR